MKPKMRSRSELSNDEDPCMANKHVKWAKQLSTLGKCKSYIHKKMQYILYKIIKSLKPDAISTIKDLKQLQLLFIAGYNKRISQPASKLFTMQPQVLLKSINPRENEDNVHTQKNSMSIYRCYAHNQQNMTII